MADLGVSCNEPTGFKLFGKMIKVKEKSSKGIDHKDGMKLEDNVLGLRCPRCESMETKFCYFNNYTVNQPWHFCRRCHRYWTTGGTLRNVPKGAGRRRTRSFLRYSAPFLKEVVARQWPLQWGSPEKRSWNGFSIWFIYEARLWLINTYMSPMLFVLIRV